MRIRNAEKEDFAIAFDFIKKLWTYNTYDEVKTRVVYERVVDAQETFAFFHPSPPASCFLPDFIYHPASAHS